MYQPSPYPPGAYPPPGPHMYHPPYHPGYGYYGLDLWPQIRPRLRELLTQFNKEQKVAETACRQAQELVRGLHSPTEVQHVCSELLYDLKRQHPQIRKLRFRVATYCIVENARLVTSNLSDMIMKHVVGVLEQERQTNLQEMANLLQGLARALTISRGRPAKPDPRRPQGPEGPEDEPDNMVVNRELIAPLMKLAVSTPGPAGKPKASAACFLLNNVLSEVLKNSVPRDVLGLAQEVLKNMLDMMNTGFLSLDVVEIFFIIRQLVEVLGPEIPGPLVRKMVKTCIKAVKGRADSPWQCRRQAIKTVSSLINAMQVCIHTDYPDLEFQLCPAGQELMHLKLTLVAFYDECRYDKSMQVKDEAAKAKEELNLVPERDIDLD